MTHRAPSPNLTWAELACRDGTPYPQAFIDDGRSTRLAELFESIRALWHRPLTILSAYRTPSHNRAIGGAKDSQHVHGRALDLRPPAGMTPDAMYTAIATAGLPTLGGLGLYKTFVHVDVRPRPPSGRIAHWNGGFQTKDDRG